MKNVAMEIFRPVLREYILELAAVRNNIIHYRGSCRRIPEVREWGEA